VILEFINSIQKDFLVTVTRPCIFFLSTLLRLVLQTISFKVQPMFSKNYIIANFSSLFLLKVPHAIFTQILGLFTIYKNGKKLNLNV
jgi:hypothetical protein